VGTGGNGNELTGVLTFTLTYTALTVQSMKMRPVVVFAHIVNVVTNAQLQYLSIFQILQLLSVFKY